MSAHYDHGHNATLAYVIIVSAHVSTSTSTAVTAIHCNYPRSTICDHQLLDDDRFVSAAACFLPTRPRKGAYIALIPPPHLVPCPELETPPRSTPRVVRQAGWRLAVHTRHVTTSL